MKPPLMIDEIAASLDSIERAAWIMIGFLAVIILQKLKG